MLIFPTIVSVAAPLLAVTDFAALWMILQVVVVFAITFAGLCWMNESKR